LNDNDDDDDDDNDDDDDDDDEWHRLLNAQLLKNRLVDYFLMPAAGAVSPQSDYGISVNTFSPAPFSKF
jgi:hypothetical protein